MSKSKIGLGVIIAIAATLIFLQYQTQQKLRAENASLRQQMAQLKSSDQEAPPTNPDSSTSKDLDELLRLRGEVSALRSQTNQIAKLEAQNQQLRQATVAAEEKQRTTTDEEQQRKAFGIMLLNTSRQYVLGMMNYANDHQGQFPTNFNQISSYFQNSDLSTNMDRFEMVYTGSYSNISNPSSAIIVREIQPWPSKGRWMRTYSFADGHSELHREDTPDKFDEWEQQHAPILQTSAGQGIAPN